MSNYVTQVTLGKNKIITIVQYSYFILHNMV